MVSDTQIDAYIDTCISAKVHSRKALSVNCVQSTSPTIKEQLGKKDDQHKYTSGKCNVNNKIQRRDDRLY